MNDLEPLDTLIGGYLNQDWPEEYGDPWLAVEAFVRYEPEYASLLRADVESLIAQCHSDRELERRLDKFALGYAATNGGWSSYSTWLQAVADRVDELLRTSPAA
jgi:hypothetical protein